jgi:hypothetical protein
LKVEGGKLMTKPSGCRIHLAVSGLNFGVSLRVAKPRAKGGRLDGGNKEIFRHATEGAM